LDLAITASTHEFGGNVNVVYEIIFTNQAHNVLLGLNIQDYDPESGRNARRPAGHPRRCAGAGTETAATWHGPTSIPRSPCSPNGSFVVAWTQTDSFTDGTTLNGSATT